MAPDVSLCIHKNLQYPAGCIPNKFNEKNKYMHLWGSIVFMYDAH